MTPNSRFSDSAAPRTGPTRLENIRCSTRSRSAALEVRNERRVPPTSMPPIGESSSPGCALSRANERAAVPERQGEASGGSSVSARASSTGQYQPMVEREHDRGGAVAQVELIEDAPDVGFHRALADH